MNPIFQQKPDTLRTPSVCATKKDPVVTDNGLFTWLTLSNVPPTPFMTTGSATGTALYNDPAYPPGTAVGITVSNINGFFMGPLANGILQNWFSYYIDPSTPPWVTIFYGNSPQQTYFLSPSQLTP